MNIPIQNLDLVIASAAAGLFVAPTFYHFAADVAARPGRSFSLIPHKGRHLMLNVFRVGLIATAALVSSQAGDMRLGAFVWVGLAAFMVFLMAGATDMRLTIDAESGLVRWRKISLIWWPAAWSPVNFVDTAPRVSFNSRERKMHLLGVAELEKHYSVNYNGSNMSSGHYSERTLARIAEQVNDYLEAFERHDTEPARKERIRVREQVQASRAPRRERKAARIARASLVASDKESRREAKQAARVAKRERARLRRVQQKFQ